MVLVRANGVIQVTAGTLLALGKLPRLAALVPAGSLVPTTYAGHQFWNEVDDEDRAKQQIQFLKNLPCSAVCCRSPPVAGQRTGHDRDWGDSAGPIWSRGAYGLIHTAGPDARRAPDQTEGAPRCDGFVPETAPPAPSRPLVRQVGSWVRSSHFRLAITTGIAALVVLVSDPS